MAVDYRPSLDEKFKTKRKTCAYYRTLLLLFFVPVAAVATGCGLVYLAFRCNINGGLQYSTEGKIVCRTTDDFANSTYISAKSKPAGHTTIAVKVTVLLLVVFVVTITLMICIWQLLHRLKDRVHFAANIAFVDSATRVKSPAWTALTLEAMESRAIPMETFKSTQVDPLLRAIHHHSMCELPPSDELYDENGLLIEYKLSGGDADSGDIGLMGTASAGARETAVHILCETAHDAMDIIIPNHRNGRELASAT